MVLIERERRGKGKELARLPPRQDPVIDPLQYTKPQTFTDADSSLALFLIHPDFTSLQGRRVYMTDINFCTQIIFYWFPILISEQASLIIEPNSLRHVLLPLYPSSLARSIQYVSQPIGGSSQPIPPTGL